MSRNNSNSHSITQHGETKGDLFRLERFGKAMVGFGGLFEQYSVEYDWAGLGAGVVVDVGGSYGHK